MSIIVPFLTVIALIVFSIYYKIDLARSRSRSRAALKGNPDEPRLTPAEQERLDHEALNEEARRAYSAAAVNGQLPDLPRSTFQRVGTALFWGELGYGSYRLLGGGHHEHPDQGNHYGFDAVDLDNL